MATIQKYTPFYPVHPGEVIKEELQARGLSQRKLADIMQASHTMLNEILNGKRPVSTGFALEIEASMGISAELLVNMQTRYNLQVARQDKDLIARLDTIRSHVASFA